jgi:hypothetical protein
MSQQNTIFKCNFCNKIFKNNSGLSSHCNHCKSNPDNTADNKVCKYCKKQFSNISNLNSHLEEKSCVEYVKYIEKELENYKIKINSIKNNYEIQIKTIKIELNKEQQQNLILKKEINIQSNQINEYKLNLQTILNISQNTLNKNNN